MHAGCVPRKCTQAHGRARNARNLPREFSCARSLGLGLGAGTRNEMVRTAIVGIVDGRERGAGGSAVDPEGGLA